MQPMRIRPARKRDLAAVIRLLADDKIGTTREVASDQLDPRYEKAFAAMDADPRNEFMVAQQAGEIVGCLQLTFIPGLSRMGMERAQIESVRVARALRGQGLGRRLFEWAIARAREKGCGLVQLTMDRSRDDAHEFYRSLGFEPSHVGMKLHL